jgi:hypothetical protein
MLRCNTYPRAKSSPATMVDIIEETKMGTNPASYKFEKRKKEIARQKKQEEKRQRQIQKKQEKLGETPLPLSDESLISPVQGTDMGHLA